MITTVTLKNFRCFKHATFDFTGACVDARPGVTIIQGGNGSGKTSILEAIHYGCYLRSFRTHVPVELHHAQADMDGFAIHITTKTDTLSIGVLDKKRSVRLNGTPITSYHELVKFYRVVTFTEDDIQTIKGYPEVRRSLIDNALLVQEPHYHHLLRSLRKIADQRTKIVQHSPLHHEQYDLWTEQLIEVSEKIITLRKRYIDTLMTHMNTICTMYDSESTESFLNIRYQEKRHISTLNDRASLLRDELRAQRTLYGPHLDDIEFLAHGRNSRAFASRGQQKLALMLLKIAQARFLAESATSSNPIIFLIDDFLTDFDEVRVQKLVNLLLKLQVQLIITTPQPHPLLYSLCAGQSDLRLITIDA